MGAHRIDKENGNTKWQDAIDIDLDQIKEYKVFKAWDQLPEMEIYGMCPRVTRQSGSISCFLSNMMDATKLNFVWMDISEEKLLKQFTQELCP